MHEKEQQNTERIKYRGILGINGCLALIVGAVAIFLHVLLTPHTSCTQKESYMLLTLNFAKQFIILLW